jgi:competence protein ComEC
MSRKISIYNSLAASAFVLLLFQPNLIWDIGFQLSYLALTGIVFFHPIIYKQIYFKNFITDWIWNITAVGIAAQIVTLPLSLFYFHQFPSYFWLSGLVVIPLSTVALYAGFALLLFSWVPVLNFIIAKILYFSIYLMNALVFLIQKIPLSVIDYFNVSILEMWLMYFIIIASIMVLILKRKYWTFIGLSSILFIIVINVHYKISNYNEDKIYVYKLNKGTMLDFFYKNIAVTLVDSSKNSISKSDFINYNNTVKHNISKLNLTTLFNDEFENSNIKIDKNGLVQFKDIKLALPPKIILNEDIFLSKKPIVDYLILTSNPRIKDLNHLENIFNYKILVFDASNSQYRINKWINQCKTLGIPFIDCSYKGKDILTALKK